MAQPSSSTCVFNTCCGCIELRTGCLIIGYISLVFQILYIILGLLGLVAGGVVIAKGDKEQQDFGVILLVVSIIILILLVFYLASTIVLLVGVHKNKRGHVKAYLITGVIILVLFVISVLASLAGTIVVKDLITNIIAILINVYFLLVIRSFYLKMDERKPVIYSAA